MAYNESEYILGKTGSHIKIGYKFYWSNISIWFLYNSKVEISSVQLCYSVA